MITNVTAAGLLLLGLSWLFLVPVYDQVRYEVWTPLAIAGMLLVVFGSRNRIRTAQPAHWGVLALFGICCLLPWPYSWPFLVLAFAAACSRLAPLAAWSGVLTFLGTALAVQVGVLVITVLLGERLGETGWLRALAATASRLTGISAVLEGEGLWCQLETSWSVVRASMDSTGITTTAMALAPLVLLSSRFDDRALWRTVLVVLAYAFVRYAALQAWCIHDGRSVLPLCLPVVHLLTCLPLAVLLLALPGPTFAGSPAPLPDRPVTRIPTLTIAAGMIGSLLVLSYVYNEPGRLKSGRILVDDAHGPWEPGTVPRTLDDFGTDSVYNYSAMWDWLSRFYPVEIKTEGRLTPEQLARHDILVLKTPSLRYTAAEIDAIEGFVRRGGGLFAIGDHTDVFGTTTCLNHVLQRTGLAIDKNVGGLINQRYVGNYRWRVNPLLPNPLTCFIRNGFDFMGPARVRITEGLLDHGIMAMTHALDPVDYRDGSFFGDTDPTIDDLVSPFYVCVAKHVDLGRVVVWGDSTVFSNFSMFEPGKPEVVQGIINYLNRSNIAGSWLKSLLHDLWPVLLGAFLLLIAVLPIAYRPLAISGVALGIIATAQWCSWRLQSEYVWPEERRHFNSVGFDWRFGEVGVDIPRNDLLAVEQSTRSEEYQSLFAGVMRVPDCFPRIVEEDSDLDGLELLCVVDPRTVPSTSELESIYDAVRRGMMLLVIESAAGDGSTADTFLEPVYTRILSRWSVGTPVHGHQMLPRELAATHAGVLAVLDAGLSLAGWGSASAPGPLIGRLGVPILAVEGGAPMWTVGERAVPILTKSAYGRGAVFAFSGGAAFRNTAMGGLSDGILVYDPQRESYVLLARLLREVLKLDSPPRKTPEPAPTVGIVPTTAARDKGVRLPTSIEIFARLAERQAQTTGTLRANVACLIKHWEQAAFLAGFAACDADRGVVEMAGDNGTGKLVQLGRERFWLEPAAVVWSRSKDPQVMRIPLPPGRTRTGPLTPPAAWRGRTWTVRKTDEDPRSELNRAMTRAKGDLFTLASKVAEDAERNQFIPADEWKEIPVGGGSYILISDEDLPVAGGWLGRIEMWVDEKEFLLRKLIVSFRYSGGVNVTEWYDSVIVFEGYQENKGSLTPRPRSAEQYFPPQLQIERLRGK